MCVCKREGDKENISDINHSIWVFLNKLDYLGGVFGFLVTFPAAVQVHFGVNYPVNRAPEGVLRLTSRVCVFVCVCQYPLQALGWTFH